ncbi:uroporphyrinogen-III C-methyltransferase [Nocardioides sp. Y6]|uniref:uroporphyrinogen-III C-methyltransferase n=1 Tax=Nocardioides malaquae TaxID=2773426 RepID=A0ABR9RX95_9ACTN|nr:uroporphyrinogen-III C-methyltransferase [Nocardioides malaquae]MBE7325755.1 uroporphyrinogen-III C-methyltransferase [Nocardioides malaquae]
MSSLAPLLPGTVALVGGGPGDAGLMTVAGRAAVEQADVLLVDHLAPEEALTWAPVETLVVDVAKLPRGAFTPQERINELLVEHARAGRRVVRLKGGDGFVFGRGMEELQACTEAEVPVRVIPGVTSSVAVPALAGIPVTHRGIVQGFTVISGHVPPGHPASTLDYGALARSGTTLVVLMGVATLPAITAALVENGLDPTTPAAVIARGGHPDQRVVSGPVADIAVRAAHVDPPAVTVIGEVASFAAVTAASTLEEVN